MKKILVCLTLLVLLFLAGCSSTVYEVKFLVDGDVVSTQQIKKGDDAVAPSDPIKEGHIFTGWDKEYKKVKSNLEINAVFEKETFVVKFYDDDNNVIKEETVAYGESATAPTAPDKEGYKFSKWDVDFSNITEEIEVRPIYERLKYTVIFQDQEGNVLKEMTVAHGNTASFTDVKKPGYKFMGWDKDTSSVKENMTVTAKFELEVYTITYKDEEGNVIEGLTPSTYTVKDDASITLPDLIEKEGFECLGWYEGNTRVVTFFSSDAVNKEYVIKYKELEKPLELPNDYTFLFKNIRKVAHSSGNGTFVYQPDFTGLSVQTGATNWDWSSLNPDIVTISQWSSITMHASGYGIIKAQNKNDPSIIGYAVVYAGAEGVVISSIEEANTKIEFEVTFTDENGTVIETQKVEKGKAATLPTPPGKEGYTFVGWSGEHYNIQENITLEPTYVEGKADFSGKTISILGDSITTYKGYNPDGYATFYPYPTADFGDVNQTWWMQVINNLGMKLLKNNSWGGSCVAEGTGSSSTSSDERIKEILFGTEQPDILIIFMGSNDCASANVSLETFDKSYKIMLDKIVALCPNTEVYIMTLPESIMYSSENQVKYNDVIRKYTTQFNFNLIDLQDMYGTEGCRNYLIDSAHPNLAGMNLFANTVFEKMLACKGIEYKK